MAFQHRSKVIGSIFETLFHVFCFKPVLDGLEADAQADADIERSHVAGSLRNLDDLVADGHFVRTHSVGLVAREDSHLADVAKLDVRHTHCIVSYLQAPDFQPP